MRISLLALIILMTSLPVNLHAGDTLINDIDKLILRYEIDKEDVSSMSTEKLLEKADLYDVDAEKLSKSIIEQIEKNPKESYALMKKKIYSPDISDFALTIYFWAMGFTKNEETVDDMIKLSGQRKSLSTEAMVNALGRFGTEKSNNYLFELLKKEKDYNTKFNILSSLSQFKYDRALPYSYDFLNSDLNESYWRLIFIFGKYGDSCIPYLLEHVSDKNNNARYNSIFVLGNILMYDEITPVLVKNYWNEKDKDIRSLMITVSVNLYHDKNSLFQFLEEVIKKEKDKELKELAEKFLGEKNNIEYNIQEYKKKKSVNAGAFEKEFSKSLKSYGKDCDFKILGITSDIKDEKKLVQLRENLLLRNSDECLYDLKKINSIILYNRLIAE